MGRKIPTFQIPNVSNPNELGKFVENALNDLALRINSPNLPVDLNVSNHQVKNLANPTEANDAVNLASLKEHIERLRKDVTVGLSRPRKPGPVPGAFRNFTATHYLNRPDLPCAEAEPKIRVTVGLPTQVSLTSGLVSDEVKKRNTDYVEVQSEWDALTANLGSAATGSTSTMTIGTGLAFKANTTYKINEEILRVTSGWTGASNAVTVERGQEGSTPAAHVSTDLVYWFSRAVREEFSPNDNGVLTVEPLIVNSERVSVRVFTGYSVNNEGFPGSTSTTTLTLAQPPVINDLVGDPRYGEVLLTWSEHDDTSSTYKYRVYRRTDGGALSSVPPFAIAQIYDEVDATHIGSYVYTDKLLLPGDANYSTTTYTYGVEAINILCTAGTGDTAGPLFGDATPEQAVPDVTGISAVESAECSPGGETNSEVTVSFTVPSDPDWGSVKVYMLKPGDTNPALIAEFNDSPGLFITPTTNETVTLHFSSVTLGGQQNLPILSQPNTTVLLDGQQSAPSAVSDLFCQIIEDTLVVNWDNNVECDLANYEIADTGDIAPPTQSDVEDKHIIAVSPASAVPPGASATMRPRYEFREPMYTGVSNGTVITMPESGSYWPDNMVLVDGTGRNVHIITPTSTDAAATGNNGTSITFAPAAIPAGTVEFWIRGAVGEHSFYVRAVNNSGLKSNWRPAPPTQLECLPTIPDGSFDDKVPVVTGGIPFIAVPSPSLWARHSDAPTAPQIPPGKIRLICHANTGAPESTTSDNVTKRKGIGGIKTWIVLVESKPSNDSGASTTTSTFYKSADITETQYTTETLVDTNTAWAVITNLFTLDIPGVSIRQITLHARNWWGTGTGISIFDFNGTQSSASHARHTGYFPKGLNINVDLASSNNLDIEQTEYFTHTLTVATSTILNPTNAAIGDEFTVIVQQDATGGRECIWDSEFLGPNNYDVDGTINSYNVFKFKTIASGTHMIIAEPVLGLV